MRIRVPSEIIVEEKYFVVSDPLNFELSHFSASSSSSHIESIVIEFNAHLNVKVLSEIRSECSEVHLCFEFGIFKRKNRREIVEHD